MFPKVVKYIVLTCVAGVILFLGSVYFWGLFTSSDYTSFTKIQIEKIFEIQLPSYKVDSIWRRESFTHDIFEYQELQFDSMNQREWMMLLDNTKSRIGDTTLMGITVHGIQNLTIVWMALMAATDSRFIKITSKPRL